MFSTNANEPTSTTRGGATDTDRRTTTGTTSSQPSCQQQQQQQGSTLGNMMGTSSSSQAQQQPQESQRRTAEPYPPQETTWWEEAQTPNPHRTEQGCGPGPTGGRSGGQDQPQYGQYGGRSRDNKRARANQEVVNWNKVAKIICSIFLPPLGVFLETGCDKNFAINVLLTILGYLPGIIHALYVIFTD